MERLKHKTNDRWRSKKRSAEKHGETHAMPAAPDADQAPHVQVISGASVQSLALAGYAITQARELVAQILGVDPQAPVLVNGQPAAQDYRLAGGETLEFVHHAGEKGAAFGSQH